MEFANPVFLAALAAAALPVVIHLAGRRRAREVQFPTLRFVLGADRALARRHKLRERIILIARVAALCLLALGLALPRLRSEHAAWVGTRETSTVIVIDNSLSMRAHAGGVTLLARAAQAARAYLARLGESEKAAVIALCGAEGKTPSLVRDRAAVAAEVERIAPTYFAADLREALALAAKTLEGDTAPATQILVVSDFPEDGAPPAAPPPEGTRIIALKTPAPAGPNLAFRELRALDAAGGGAAAVRCAVANTGTAAGRGEIILRAGDKEVARGAVLVPAGGAATEVFTLADAPSDLLSARIECRDDVLPEDNEGFLVIGRGERARVLLVKDRESAVKYLDEAFWAHCALSMPSSGIEVETALVADLPRESLDRVALIVVFGAARLGENAAGALRAYVRAGGTVLFVAGDAFDFGAYRALAAGLFPLFPAMPSDVAVFEDVPIGHVDERHEALRALLALRPPPNLRGVVFRRCVRVEKVAPPAAVLIELENGLPLLVERPLGAGRALFFAAAMTPHWTALPLRVAFVPLLHSLVRDAAGRSARALALSCGDMLSVSAEGAPARLAGPRGEVAPAAPEDRETRRFGPLAEPGFYLLSRGEEPPARIAVNVPARESALRGLAAGAIKELLGAEAVIPLGDPGLAAARAQALVTGKELRNLFLMAMLGIAAIEGLLAMWWAARRYAWKR